MANSRQVKNNIRRLRRVQTWQLLVLLILFGFIAATLLRLNNIGMTQRRDAVLAADREGNEDTLQTRMYDLQRYVSQHMNAGTGAFYLEGQYQRDSQALIEAATAVDNNPATNANAQAAAVCDPQFTLYSQPYFQCFLRELERAGAAEDPATSTVNLPNPEGYRHSFAAPVISFDIAGLAVVLCGLIIVAIISRLIGLLVLRAMLRHHYKGA